MFWQAPMCLLQCTLAMSSGYHPQTDVWSEGFHHSIEQIICFYMTFSQKNQVLALDYAAFTLNSTISVAHGKSLFVVLFLREPTLPLDLAMTKLSKRTVQAVYDFIHSQKKSFFDFFMVLAKTNESMACKADKHHCDVQFHTGNLIYSYTTHFSSAPRLSRKLAAKWVGPFPIEQVISSVAYFISLPEEYGHIHPVFNISSLHRHHGPPLSCIPPIFPVADSPQPEYIVEAILAQCAHCS